MNQTIYCWIIYKSVESFTLHVLLIKYIFMQNLTWSNFFHCSIFTVNFENNKLSNQPECSKSECKILFILKPKIYFHAHFYLLDDALRLGLDGGGGWPCPSTPNECGEAPPSRQFGPPAWSPLKLPEMRRRI